MRTNRLAVIAALAVAALAGCSKVRPAGGEGSSCTACHGDAARGSTLLLNDAAPPRGTHGETLDTDLGVGAHQTHLNGSAFSAGFACESCHAAITGRHPTGTIELDFGALNGTATHTVYDRAAHTCASYCHDPLGAGLTTPAWNVGHQSAGGVMCGSCHPLPPTTGGHPSSSHDLTTCKTCHPQTMNADGTINRAGGMHVNGMVDAIGGHGDYSLPSVHGPAFFAFLKGTAGALDCRACHGQDYGGGSSAPSCTQCHTTDAGWTSDWRTNCSFCHGTRTQAGFDVAASPALAAPPDAVQERLDGTPVPSRTGAHQAHLAQGAFAKGFPCATCHTVPTATFPAAFSHIDGNDAVIFTGTAVANGFAPGYAGGSCTVYCHSQGGSSPTPSWTGAAVQCGDCHALPPGGITAHQGVTSRTECSSCHPDTVDASGDILVAGGKHLNGRADVASGHPAGYGDPSSAAFHGADAIAFLQGTGSSDCTQCHGATLDGDAGPSCTACHQTTPSAIFPGGVADWKTNCTFCHGTPTGPSFDASTQLARAAPPDDVAGRLTGTNTAAVGAHQKHVTAGALWDPVATSPGAPCANCHLVPTDLAHLANTSWTFTWSTLATGNGSTTPAWTAGSLTCANYCHGATLNGGTHTSPTWNGGAAEVSCTSCHGSPPATGATIGSQPAHLYHAGQGVTCDRCHSGYNSSTANTAEHVNGIGRAVVKGQSFTTFTNNCNNCHNLNP